MTQSDAPNEGREEKHLEFLREYAKCGIYHNHTDNDLKHRLKLMDDAISFLRDQLSKEREKALKFVSEKGEEFRELQQQLEKEREIRKELVESLKDTIRNVPFDASGNSVVYAIESVLKKASELDKT